MTAVPEGLFPGPVVDGRPTWYAVVEDVPEDWECREAPSAQWRPRAFWCSDLIVQCRPMALPDPTWLRTGFGGPAATEMVTFEAPLFGVTTVGEMRDRADLDQWEWASACHGTWTPWFPEFEAAPDFPVIVRRRP